MKNKFLVCILFISTLFIVVILTNLNATTINPYYDHFANSQAVFIGKVASMKKGVPAWHLRRLKAHKKSDEEIEKDDVYECGEIKGRYWVTLRVFRVFKGRRPKALTVMTYSNYLFSIDQEYLVFANQCSSGILVTDSLMGTRPLAIAGPKISEIEKKMKLKRN